MNMSCGSKYANPYGKEIDIKKALHWYEKAAEQGDILAKVACAAIYDSIGTSDYKVKAQNYLRDVIEQTEYEEIRKQAKQLLNKLY